MSTDTLRFTSLLLHQFVINKVIDPYFKRKNKNSFREDFRKVNDRIVKKNSLKRERKPIFDPKILFGLQPKRS